MSKGLFSEEKRAQLEAVARKGGLLLAEYNKPLWPAPYNEATPESCYRFLVECIWTFDEATGKDTPMPDKDYLRLIVDEWYDCRKTGRQLHFIKSRRLVVTWALRAIELHEAGLARGRYVIAAEVFEGNNGACGFVFRIKYLYDQLRARYTSKEAKEYGWNLKEATATGGRGSSQAQEVVLPNGSTFIAGNSDPSKFQGSGAGYICLEEASQYAELEPMLSQASINTQGAATGGPGGMVVSVNNATDNPTFLDVMEPHDGEKLLTYGVARARDNLKGHRIVEIHYAADPDKNEAWASKYRGMDIPIRQWNREMEGMILAFSGEPVFACYDKEIHEHQIEFPASSDPGVLIAGWDVGLSPAFVLGFVDQQRGRPSQLQILMEVLGEGMTMEEFAPKVAGELDKRWPSWRLREHEIIHVADPSGNNREGNTGTTAFRVARNKGFFLRKSSNGLQGRLSCVTRFLMNWAEESVSPLLVVNRRLCRVVCEAFSGGYVYRPSPATVGAARTLREPRKDGYSHPMDAVQYLCMEAEKHIGGKVSLETIDRFSPRRAGSRIQTRTV